MEVTTIEPTTHIQSIAVAMKYRMGIGVAESNISDTYERGKNIVPDCISATENETPIKQYNLAILRNLLKFERAEGRLQITNKRVIFRATGGSIKGKTTLQQEYAIDEIAGIEARKNFKFNVLFFIFALLIIYVAYTFTFKTGITNNMMNPGHIQKARQNEQTAIRHRIATEDELPKAEAKWKPASDALARAERDAKDGIQKTRTVTVGSGWNARQERQTYRDKSPESMAIAAENLKNAQEEMEKVEAEIDQARKNIEDAKQSEAKAIKKRINREKFWTVLMTIFGLILGFGGLLPFFMWHKKFGRKLLLLCVSVFGFSLAVVASGIGFFKLFLWISQFITLVCMFIYSIRPNLVLCIINKFGLPAAVDVRRENPWSTYIEKGLGFSEVIPTDEAENAISEIGAIVKDLQKQK